jgi:hypothetical protein
MPGRISLPSPMLISGSVIPYCYVQVLILVQFSGTDETLLIPIANTVLDSKSVPVPNLVNYKNILKDGHY